MGVRVEERVVPGTGPRRTILLVQPQGELRAGRERIEAFERDGHRVSEIDARIIDAVNACSRDTVAFVFQGDDGQGNRWVFDPELNDSEREALGYHLFRSQLPINRACARRGIYESIYVTWSGGEIDAFRAGVAELTSQLRERGRDRSLDEATRARARLHAWLVERHSFYSDLPLELLLRDVMPRRIERLESRRAELDAMFADLPPDERVGETW